MRSLYTLPAVPPVPLNWHYPSMMRISRSTYIRSRYGQGQSSDPSACVEGSPIHAQLIRLMRHHAQRCTREKGLYSWSCALHPLHRRSHVRTGRPSLGKFSEALALGKGLGQVMGFRAKGGKMTAVGDSLGRELSLGTAAARDRPRGAPLEYAYMPT